MKDSVDHEELDDLDPGLRWPDEDSSSSVVGAGSALVEDIDELETSGAGCAETSAVRGLEYKLEAAREDALDSAAFE